MRRAVAVATGYDPAREFEHCPVHVVVLASNMGPVPYELEDIYPANVRGGGVKHFSGANYARVKPILAARVGEYITSHRQTYERIATFTDGRYGEVMREAATLANVQFPVFPDRHGATVCRMGTSTPRKYWEKHWIQLYLEIEGWLDGAARTQARSRLEALDVEYALGAR